MTSLQQELYEMANLDKELTGLPVNLWVDSSGQKRDNKHGPYRLKFQNNYRRLVNKEDMISITIHKTDPEVKPPYDGFKLGIKERDLTLVKRFIIDNFEDLELLVQNKINDRELIHRLEAKNSKLSKKVKVGV